MKDFCVEQQVGFDLLVKIGEILGTAGVNIAGLCLANVKDQGVIHFVVEDDVTTKRILENSGIKIKTITDVFVLEKDQKRITGKPGSFGEICKTLSDQGIQINFGYPAENNRFIFGVTDVQRAYELLG
ncbi:MAG: hypothetical protein GY799_14775 [Desulfobulbaceae bacterium]|nr:hypothetical protein [Desulfobulbaceae bacterium]